MTQHTRCIDCVMQSIMSTAGRLLHHLQSLQQGVLALILGNLNAEEFLDIIGLGNRIVLHLVHDEVDIELATVENLSDAMLTDEGRRIWSDVLGAKVDEIFNGYYGIQIQCSDVDHKRLSDFSYALAGYCPESDYNNWFIDIEDGGPNMNM